MKQVGLRELKNRLSECRAGEAYRSLIADR
jgi:hypothetical protein